MESLSNTRWLREILSHCTKPLVKSRQEYISVDLEIWIEETHWFSSFYCKPLKPNTLKSD